ncbi:hypothetical protein JCM15519_22540 [Fundidesulfovibrio butyratiphilus]
MPGADTPSRVESGRPSSSPTAGGAQVARLCRNMYCQLINIVDYIVCPDETEKGFRSLKLPHSVVVTRQEVRKQPINRVDLEKGSLKARFPAYLNRSKQVTYYFN